MDNLLAIIILVTFWIGLSLSHLDDWDNKLYCILFAPAIHITCVLACISMIAAGVGVVFAVCWALTYLIS